MCRNHAAARARDPLIRWSGSKLCARAIARWPNIEFEGRLPAPASSKETFECSCGFRLQVNDFRRRVRVDFCHSLLPPRRGGMILRPSVRWPRVALRHLRWRCAACHRLPSVAPPAPGPSVREAGHLRCTASRTSFRFSATPPAQGRTKPADPARFLRRHCAALCPGSG
jgi:hypothetical protein